MNQPIHWTAFKTHGNKYLMSLTSEMKTLNGCVLVMYRKKRGKDEYETTSVKYDMSYVVEKLKREYLEALDCSWEEFIHLVDEYLMDIRTPDKEDKDEEEKPAE